MSTDQKPASTDQTPVPTPPLAPSAKSTNKASKPDASTKKAKKIRKLTDAQIAEAACKLVDIANTGAFLNKTISVAGLANQLNISQSMVERVFIRSLLQKKDYELDYGSTNSAAGKRPYVDARGMIMLPKSLIAAFNATAPADKQFTIGQPVDATFEDGKLVLTPGI